MNAKLRIAGMGHVLFALSMIAIGIVGLVNTRLSPVWDGVPRDMPQATLARLCALIALGSGIGLLIERTGVYAARVLLAWLLLWLLVFKVRYIVMAPWAEVSYQDCGETAVVIAAAWVLYAWFAGDWDKRRLGFATGTTGVRIARVFYGLALIAFGLSHLVYFNLTAPLIPGWLPWHPFWAYFTATAFLAAATAILVGVAARLAATLSALQIGVFLALVWIPRVVTGHANNFQQGEFIITGVLTASAWVVADSYRGLPWLAANRG